jgi:RNA polymerase sigma factor (sigma-70 family)
MTPTEPPPASLFERLSHGDPEAMEEICHRYGARVYHLARRRLHGALRARLETGDVAQESMAAVIRDAPRCTFPSEAAFLGWVRRIVEHKILVLAKRHRRSRQCVRNSVRIDGAPRTDPRAESPSSIIMRREARDGVAQALTELPDDDRALMIARAVLKLPWEVIARSRGQSQAALQMRYMRLRRDLASILVRRGACR